MIAGEVLVFERGSLPNIGDLAPVPSTSGGRVKARSVLFDSRKRYPGRADFSAEEETESSCSSQRIPRPAAGYTRLPELARRSLDVDCFRTIAAAIQAEFELSLFGFDVICPCDAGGGMLVVDVNYFPSYKEVIDFPRRLRRMLISRARSRSNSNRRAINQEVFEKRFNSIGRSCGFSQELEIAADSNEVLWWLHPRRRLNLDALSAEVEFFGNHGWWFVEIKRRSGFCGLTLNLVSTLEAIVVHEEGQMKILSVERFPGGQRQYTVWRLRRRGSDTLLSEDVRCETGGWTWMIGNELRQCALKTHKELLNRLKMNCEAQNPSRCVIGGDNQPYRFES